MKGEVYLIKRGFGKILYENKETPLLSLPESFENGDIAEFEIDNEKIVKLRAYSKDEYYGFVVQKFNQNSGIIVVTYPQMRGTLFFRGAFGVGEKLKFKIKKLFKSQEAVDIEILKKQFYKAHIPSFGKLIYKKKIPREGFVKEIITTKTIKGAIRGKIKALRDDRGFGFIKSEIGDIFFKINWYISFYKNIPRVGDKVIFRYKEGFKGLSVERFYQEERLKEPLILLDNNKKVPVKSFVEFYKKEPEPGDIVSYFEESMEFALKEKEEIFFKPYMSFKYLKGEISYINKERGFAFIKSSAGDIFFYLEKYQSFYKKEPYLGEKVAFIFQEGKKGLEVKSFVNEKIRVKRSNFINFVNIEKDTLYFAYIYNNQTKEIYKYNKDNLHESIALYKSKNIPDEYRLLAIECMLKNNYSNKHISKELLLNEKKELLKKLAVKNPQKYMMALQKMEFDLYLIKPSSKPIEFIYPEDIKKPPFAEKKIDFIEIKELKELQNEEKISPLYLNEIKELKFKEKKWNI